MKKIFIKFCLLMIISGIFFIWQGIYLPKDLGFAESKLFLVERGQGLFQIAENLEKEELIKNKIFLEGYVFFKGKARELQSGEYFLTPSMIIPEIVEKLATGDVVKEEITIIEGWNLRDIGWYFENKGMFQAEELFELVGFPLIDYSRSTDLPKPKDFSFEYDFLKDKPRDTGLEGYLFPDTYQINKGATLEEIVRKMLSNFDKKLTLDLREEIGNQEKTIFEIITMASLLEKEVRTLEDKEIVSGIFWKRIKEKKPLQSCATIAYIKGFSQWRYSFEDTRIESSYNTYLNLGLPQGPISNPGIDSIKAAIFPKTTEYNYFLNDPETGETIFSKTLEEHNIAKAKYFK